MLIVASKLLNIPIMSLQTGSEIARTKKSVVDPANLAVIGYSVEGSLLDHTKQNFLRIEDSRELSDIGLIVDSIDDLVQFGEVIKLDDVINLDFHLEGMRVVDEKRKSVGKITDFTIDVGNFHVQQLTVKRPLLRGLNDTELVIHRSQIIEINDDDIVVHSEAKTPEHTLVTTPGSYVNPFRKGNPAESVDLRQR